MGWRMLVLLMLLMLVACGRAAGNQNVKCSIKVSDLRVGEVSEATCTCINAENESLQIYVEKEGTFNGTRNGNVLLYRSTKLDQKFYQRHECLVNGNLYASAYVNVYPRLEVTDFRCSYWDVEYRCQFAQMEEHFFKDETHYQLSRNSDKPVECSKNEKRRVLCQVPANRGDVPGGTFHLLMSDNLGNQTQQFPLKQTDVEVLDWPEGRDGSLNSTDKAKANEPTCYWWNGPVAHRTGRMVEWNVMLRHEDPRLSRNLTVHQMRIHAMQEKICFASPPEGNQRFHVSLRRRFEIPNAQWSLIWNLEKELETEISLPARPPTFLANGFAYEPKKKELRVHWEQLRNVEFNGPQPKYLVTSDNGKVDKIFKSSAIITEWDEEKPGTVEVWSQNVKGKSENSSRLEVPGLRDVQERQVTRYRYDEKSYILTWNKPERQEHLEGYMVYWCQFSVEIENDCNDNASIASQFTRYPEFNFTSRTSGDYFRRGVSTNYSDGPSGGIAWLPGNQNSPEEESAYLRYVEGSIALVVVLLVIFLVVRKLRKMADIRVELPDMSNDMMMVNCVDLAAEEPKYPGSIPAEKFYEPPLKSVTFEEPDIELQAMPIDQPRPPAAPSNQYVCMAAPSSDGYIKPPPGR
ncbi:cytokine receptor [Drosophila takahashii]|uniref:cytokine receptor n=1 Tax=Drosophila takahashii TaxID=29030 RepID=UPI001CF7FBA0|nr:cytokine receptor [Drosophila takahashii]